MGRAEQINFNQSAYWQTATLRLDIHKQLVDKNRGCLYLIGLDSEGTKFWDTLEICFREKDNRKIRISNLKPVPLDASHNSENNAYLLPFCVYVSDGSEYLLQASGLHIDNENEFNLVNGNNNRLQYKLGFSPDISGNNWLPLKPGDAETGTGNSHIDTLCGGQTNARFRIHLNDDVGSAPSGVYSDIVTVTVTPK